MSNYKMKSLLKGLRYISQIFENEKEPEMQIGNPTDVKHVAHIGWDGGAVDSPTWMNGFKNQPGGFSSSPLGDIKEDASWVSEESTRSRDMPGIPRSGRNQRSSNMGGSPTKSERSSRRRSSNPDANSKSSRKSKDPSDVLPSDGSRKSRRKKSKDSGNGGGSSRSSRRARDSSDSMSVSHDD